MSTTPEGWRLADVVPGNFGSAEWEEWLAPLLKIGAKRRPDDAHGWASDYLRKDDDEADLRALGHCKQCGRGVTLRQVGRCVYTEPCGHYRAQGDIKKMQSYLDRRLAAMSPERRASVLALLQPEAPVAAPRGDGNT
ncbi:MAG: hypothetical protein JWM95_1728 [Gemmatimonadetes bacterium]|nr:hypothetical protein [Gemmatimonadota bacterium]